MKFAFVHRMPQLLAEKQALLMAFEMSVAAAAGTAIITFTTFLLEI